MKPGRYNPETGEIVSVLLEDRNERILGGALVAYWIEASKYPELGVDEQGVRRLFRETPSDEPFEVPVVNADAFLRPFRNQALSGRTDLQHLAIEMVQSYDQNRAQMEQPAQIA
jgi:hypothetical protein